MMEENKIEENVIEESVVAENEINKIEEFQETTDSNYNMVEITEEPPAKQFEIIDICRPIAIGILSALVFGAGFLLGHSILMGQDVDYIPTETTAVVETVETIPETEAVETVESTSAPEIEATEPTDKEVLKPILSITETEDTKHTEPTETPTEPTVDTDTSSGPSSTPVSEKVNTNTPQTELEMLACVIYQEAGGDITCDNCRYRVADVVLNRVNSSAFPNTLHGVLTGYQQYGRFYWTGVVWPARANNAGERHAVERAYRIAEDVLNGNHSELYGNGYVWQAEFVQGSDGFWCCGHFFVR